MHHGLSVSSQLLRAFGQHTYIRPQILQKPAIAKRHAFPLDGADHAPGDPPGAPSGQGPPVPDAASPDLPAPLLLPSLVTNGRGERSVLYPTAGIDSPAFSTRALALGPPLLDALPIGQLPALFTHTAADAEAGTPVRGSGLLLVGVLRDTDLVEVWQHLAHLGAGGVAETLAKGAVFVSSATMDPDVARRLAKQLEASGRHYLDAPISGGAQRAAQGELTILASGSRKEALRSLKVPALVIHGADDPLVPLPAGRDTAEAIPDAELMVIAGMGHDMPRAVWPRLIEGICGIAARAA